MEIAKRFLEILDLTDRLEGGDSNDAQDKGGFTRKGAIQDDCDAYADKMGIPRFSIKDLDEARRREIFKLLYFDAARCDLYGSPLDFIVYQYAVNFIPATAIKRLQLVAECAIVDGIPGPLTASAAAAKGWDTTSRLLLTRQALHYTSIIVRSNAALSSWLSANSETRGPRPKDQRSFGPGWFNRCITAAKLANLSWIQPATDRAWVDKQHADYVKGLAPV